MSSFYREYLKELSRKSYEDILNADLKLEPNCWNWLVLVKYENNQPKKALIKVVWKEGRTGTTITWNALLQPSFTQNATTNATSPTVFDPTGVSFLHSPELTPKLEANGLRLEQASNNDILVKSIMLSGLELLPERPKIIHTYSWKHGEEHRLRNLIGLVPFSPPLDPDGICWFGEFLDDYYLSAVTYPEDLEPILIATMRLGYVVGIYELNKNESPISLGNLKISIKQENDIGKIGFKFNKEEKEVELYILNKIPDKETNHEKEETTSSSGSAQEAKPFITTDNFVLFLLKQKKNG